MRNFLLSVFLLLLISVTGVNAQKFMFVTDVDGEETVFSMSEVKLMTFPNDTMLVELISGEETDFTFDQMSTIGFREEMFLNEISEFKQKTAISLYPNPVSSELNVDLSDLNLSGNIQVRLIDLQGRVLLSKNYSESHGNSGVRFDVGHLSPGIYICQVSNSITRSQMKFIKQ